MQVLEIEAALARLMPPALSQGCQVELEEMIVELAGPEVMRVNWRARWIVGGGIAAAILALCAVFTMRLGSSIALQSLRETGPSYIIVSESDRIESMTDEGWLEDSDGSAMRTLRVSAVEENKVRDEESGMVVLISEPRDEVLYMPISAF